MSKVKRTIASLLALLMFIMVGSISVYASDGSGEDLSFSIDLSEAISVPERFEINSDMLNSDNEFCIQLDDETAFEGKVTITPNALAATTYDFKLSGRFFLPDTGETVSDYWMSASFYISSSKVYVDSYDSRHTKRTGLFSGYTAKVTSNTATGDGTTKCTVNADFELSYSGGKSTAYLKTIYNSDKTWSISGNYDYSSTP